MANKFTLNIKYNKEGELKMSCRETSAGSLATTFIGRLYGLQDSQCTSIFHQCRSNATNATPTTDQTSAYYNAINEMEERIRANPGRVWSPAFRRRALDRVEQARSDGLPSDARTATAFIQSMNAAHNFKVQSTNIVLKTLYPNTPDIELNANSVTREAAWEEFQRLTKEFENQPNSREMYRQAREASTLQLKRQLTDAGIKNNSSVWAATVIALGHNRCTQCGRFMSTQYGGASHVCPTRRRHGRGMRLPFLGLPVDETTASTGVNQPTTTTSTTTNTEVVEPWDLDDFQNTYDRAKRQLNVCNTAVPTDESLEQVPGAVTGGLGSKETGNSFGLEIELDFPEDSYPYNKREEFARILHEKGIVTYPRVQRWHYRGDSNAYRTETYEKSASNWICEYDQTVDDVGGSRGVEIKSQILFDEPETWENLRTILAVAESLGAKATPRTGLHVNIGGQKFSTTDPAAHLQLIKSAAAYDDLLVRVGHNPDSADTHRGRRFCSPVNPNDAYSSRPTVDRALRAATHVPGSAHMLNLSHLAGQRERAQRSDSRVEWRIFDGVSKEDDVGRVQAAVTMHLGMVKAALDNKEPGQELQHAGYNRSRFGRRKLNGTEWAESTLPLRKFVSLIESTTDFGANPLFREQITSMWARSRWQRN